MTSSDCGGPQCRVVPSGNAIFTVAFGILPGCVVVLALAAIGTGVGTLGGQGVVLAQSTGRARSSGADFKTHRGRPTTKRAGFAGSDGTLSGLVAVLAGDAIFTTVRGRCVLILVLARGARIARRSQSSRCFAQSTFGTHA